MDIKRVRTSKEVCKALYNTHKKELSVFSTYSDPGGRYTGGTKGAMFTSWGLKDFETPLFCIENSWDIHPGQEARFNETTDFWLLITVEEEIIDE
jgi:hypothetical protein